MKPEEKFESEITALLESRGITTVEMLREVLEPNFFAIIPIQILERRDISANAKLLYAEIMALSKKSGVCFATNDYLAERLGLEGRSITRLVKELEGNHLILVNIDKNPKGTFRKVRATFVGGGYTNECTPSTLPSVSGYAGKRIQKRNRDKEIEKVEKNAAVAAPWSEKDLSLYLSGMTEDKNPAIRLIANFLLTKGTGVSKGKVQIGSLSEMRAQIHRWLRPANYLVKSYPESKILETMQYIDENARDFVWTLETVLKMIPYSREELIKALTKNKK